MYSQRSFNRSGWRILATALATVGTVMASASWSYADRFEVSIGSAAQFMPSRSVDALSDGTLAVFSLNGSMAIERVHVPLFDRFLIDGTFEMGSMPGTSFQTLETDTSVFMAALGARLRRDVTRRLVMQARASLGVARVGVSISDAVMDAPVLRDSGYTGTSYVGVGTDYLLARKTGKAGDRFAMGLRMELGYLAVVPRSLEARPDGSDHPDGAILIPEFTAPLGDLDLSAWSLKFGVVGRF